MKVPFWALSKLELNALARSWPALHDAWRDAQQHVKGRDARGFRFWVFALGWLACAQYQQREMAQLGADVAAFAQKRADDWGRRTGLDRILE